MKRKKKIFVLMIAAAMAGLVLGAFQTALATSVEKKATALVNNAMVYSKDGKHFLAIKTVNQAIALQPNNLDFYYRRAFIWGRAGNYVNAIQDFNLIIKHDSVKDKKRFSHAHRFRADCYMGLGNMQKAVEDYSNFLRRAPRDGKVWSYLVEAYALMGRNDLALLAVKKGLSTGSHWSGRLEFLQQQILSDERIIPHKPLTN